MGDQAGSILFLLLPVLLFGWLMLLQKRRTREIQATQAAVRIGDEVRTTSGLIGTVAELTDTEMRLRVAEGVVVRFDRRAIDAVIAPAQPPVDPDRPLDQPAQEG